MIRIASSSLLHDILGEFYDLLEGSFDLEELGVRWVRAQELIDFG